MNSDVRRIIGKYSLPSINKIKNKQLLNLRYIKYIHMIYTRDNLKRKYRPMKDLVIISKNINIDYNTSPFLYNTFKYRLNRVGIF